MVLVCVLALPRIKVLLFYDMTKFSAIKNIMSFLQVVKNKNASRLFSATCIVLPSACKGTIFFSILQIIIKMANK
jgi:hypothetical protein